MQLSYFDVNTTYMTVINRSVIFILVFSAKESPDGPFYLRPKVKYSDEAGSVWYLNVPVGHNTISKDREAAMYRGLH